MGYSHYDIAHAWANNLDSYPGNCSHSMFHVSGYLYSYSTVIGHRIELDNGEILWLVQRASYSQSTGKHQGYMLNAITTGKIIDVSKYGFMYGWEGLAYDTRPLKEALESLCLDFIINFFKLLDKIPASRSIKSEDITPPVWEIETLINFTGCTTWKKLAKKMTWHKAMGIKYKEEYNKKKRLILALSEGKTSIAELVVEVFGNKAWQKHLTLTLPQQKARETRRAKEIPGYVPMDFSNIEKFDFKAEEKARRAKIRREHKQAIATLQDRKQKWIDGEGDYINSYSLGSDVKKIVFDGGNVALRVKENEVQTSKGIHIAIDECKRLWNLVKRWHIKKSEFKKDICHATQSNWPITSYVNDILTSGCHSIAYSEMKRVAKELQFC